MLLIRRFEGCRLNAYRCPAGVWTIGYGHTGKDVFEGVTITQQEAERILDKDLTRFETNIPYHVDVPLNDNQFAALVSFAFNVGLGAFSKSTLLLKLNDGDYSGAADQFMRWNKIAGRPSPGLTERRLAEKELFCSNFHLSV